MEHCEHGRRAMELRSSKEDRLRIQHESQDNERKFDSDLVLVPDKFPDAVSEETKIRKQHERLEREKQYFKRNSFLKNERRLSVVEGETKPAKSAHEKPDMSDVKSKLFDYKKSAPRSRRQLAMGTESPSSRMSTRNSPMIAIDADSLSEVDLDNHMTLTPDIATHRRKSIDPNEAATSRHDHAQAGATHRRKSINPSEHAQAGAIHRRKSIDPNDHAQAGTSHRRKSIDPIDHAQAGTSHRRKSVDPNDHEQAGATHRRKSIDPNEHAQAGTSHSRKSIDPNDHAQAGTSHRRKSIDPNDHAQAGETHRRKSIDPSDHAQAGATHRRKSIDPNAHSQADTTNRRKSIDPNEHAQAGITHRRKSIDPNDHAQAGATHRRKSIDPNDHAQADATHRRKSIDVQDHPQTGPTHRRKSIDVQDHTHADATYRRKSIDPNDHAQAGATHRRKSIDPNDHAQAGTTHRRKSIDVQDHPQTGPTHRRKSFDVQDHTHAGATHRRKSIDPNETSNIRHDYASDRTVNSEDKMPSITAHKHHGARHVRRTSNNVDSTDPEEEMIKLQALYDRAIETMTKADQSILRAETSKPPFVKFQDRRSSVGRPSSNTDLANKPGLDVTHLRELETILHDARLYSSRKSSKEDHNRLDLGSNRAQKKRIEHLEQVLKQLNPNYGTSGSELDPMKVLQCSYLRLSKSNVDTLETMLRMSGQDPGIHIHSDIANVDIWQGLHEERTDLKPEAKDAKKHAPSKKSMKI